MPSKTVSFLGASVFHTDVEPWLQKCCVVHLITTWFRQYLAAWKKEVVHKLFIDLHVQIKHILPVPGGK